MIQLSILRSVGSALTAAFICLVELNEKHGKGFIEAVKIDVDGTDLEVGNVRGTIVRNLGGTKDERAFSLAVKTNGKVKVRCLDRKRTINK